MKLSDRITYDLINFCRGSAYDIVLPNFFYEWYEMDVFRLTRNGILIEYEVKTSRSDYLSDFRKDNGRKHELLKDGKRCNRFFFVVPEGLIGLNEVPPYAGLIYADGQYLRIVKPAKLLHRNYLEPQKFQGLAIKLALREGVFRAKARHLQLRVDDLEQRLIEQMNAQNLIER